MLRSPRPLGALGVGGVAGGLVLALLLPLRPALHHVVHHVVNLLAGDALRLVLRPADLLPVAVAVLHQRGPADVDRHVHRVLAVLYEAFLDVVLLTLLFLERYPYHIISILSKVFHFGRIFDVYVM